MSRRVDDVTIKGFLVEKCLGEGAFANVYLCRKQFSRKKFAAKIVSYGSDIALRFQTENEIEILKLVGASRYIVQLHGVVREEKRIISILEYIAGCNLYEGVINWYNFTENDLKIIMRQLFEALTYCQDNHVIHRDIAPENILLVNIPTPCMPSRNVTLKLIDFNLSRKLTDGDSYICADSNGNPSYMAPESITENPIYSYQSDIWSAGIIIFVLLGGYPPFWDDNYNHLLQNIREVNYIMPKELWDYVDMKAIELIKKILVSDFRERPLAEEILSDQWINSKSVTTKTWIGRDRLSSFLFNLQQEKKRDNHRSYKLKLCERKPFYPSMKMLASSNGILQNGKSFLKVEKDENNNGIVQSYW